jgi:ribosomal protein S18 acetylase RimI-like enzyme
LQSEAARQGLPLTLKVQATNTRAIALYQRLGFVAIDDDPVFPAMRWSAT